MIKAHEHATVGSVADLARSIDRLIGLLHAHSADSRIDTMRLTQRQEDQGARLDDLELEIATLKRRMR